MKRYSLPALMTGTVFTIFWAYTIMDAQLRELAKDVTFMDLGVFFILGFSAGLSLGLVFTLRRRKSGPAAAFEIMAIFAAYWAYTNADTLIRELGKAVTLLELGSLFVLGLLAGLFIGLIVALVKANANETR